MQVGHTPEPSDLILCLGSRNLSAASRAAELYLQKLAPKILFSGGFGRFTKAHFAKSEAEDFAEVAQSMGVPSANIIVEDASGNTGENIRFSYQLLRASGLAIRSIVLVHVPFMERRTLATFEAQWPKPQPTAYVTSPQVDFDDYFQGFPEQKVVDLMVDSLQRIRRYPKLGFQSEQPIPKEVLDACEQLTACNYTEHF
jgi:uncharacterized SAM-binding protein YcdF (DUF218 family)